MAPRDSAAGFPATLRPTTAVIVPGSSVSETSWSASSFCHWFDRFSNPAQFQAGRVHRIDYYSDRANRRRRNALGTGVFVSARRHYQERFDNALFL